MNNMRKLMKSSYYDSKEYIEFVVFKFQPV